MITREQWNAYRQVQDSGATNMFDYPQVGFMSGLTEAQIKRIQNSYDVLKKKFEKKREAGDTPDDDEPAAKKVNRGKGYIEKEVIESLKAADKKPKKMGFFEALKTGKITRQDAYNMYRKISPPYSSVFKSDDKKKDEEPAKEDEKPEEEEERHNWKNDPTWTYEKPLQANIPEGWEALDMTAEEITATLEHQCDCKYCDYPEGEDENTEELGKKLGAIVVVQEDEAFGRDLEWGPLPEPVKKKKEKRAWYSRDNTDAHGYERYTWTGEGWEGVGVPFNFYLGHGCWTRYDPKNSGPGQEPYGEHVCRVLIKKITGLKH